MVTRKKNMKNLIMIKELILIKMLLELYIYILFM